MLPMVQPEMDSTAARLARSTPVGPTICPKAAAMGALAPAAWGTTPTTTSWTSM